ncbi:MAG: MBL fold metallo-hydrolase [Chloroflexota bacterium]|nr:MBL fold metallo-hydrolase [Chloroflexota bacterium]
MDLTCVVDNAVQRSSPFWGEHGAAFLIQTAGGRVLFDTGQSGTVLLHNLNLLEVAAVTIDAVALSHAHYDHTGGLPMLLEYLDRGTPLYANPDLFRERYSVRDDGLEDIGMPLTREDLTARLSLALSPEPQQILPGLWTTGTMTERSGVEGRSAHHRMRRDGALVPDAYLDDMALVLELDDRVVLLCGCCHAGLINTVGHVERVFRRPIEAIVGGLHLTSASGRDLRRICTVLAERSALQRIYPNHCTGEAALVALTGELGASVVHPCPAGTVLTF